MPRSVPWPPPKSDKPDTTPGWGSHPAPAQGHRHQEQVGCELLCSTSWPYPGSVRGASQSMCPPPSALGTYRIVLLPCSTCAMERHWKWQLGLQSVRVCGHKHINTDRDERGERLLSALCMRTESRERVNNAQHSR